MVTVDYSQSEQHHCTAHEYKFYRYPEVEKKWLSADRVLEPDTLCWVLRGRRGKVKNNTQENGKETEEEARKALFNRAWVVDPQEQAEGEDENSDDIDRVLVRYPLGSTYRVKRVNLLPVLQEKSLVVVLQDTLMYRRWAVVHTRPEDSFCEIGCDIGILVHRVWVSSDCPQHVSGLDTCRHRILEAKKRYPDCTFRQWRVPLTAQSDDDLDASQENNGHYYSNNRESQQRSALPMDLFPFLPKNQSDTNDSLVVAIDINGNRELTAVRQCIQIVIQQWKPRLVIVKSTALYADLSP